jgi:hypothetical protein
LVLCFSFNLVFCVLLLIGFLAFPKSALHTPTWRTNCGRESTVPPKWWVAREKAPPPSQETPVQPKSLCWNMVLPLAIKII